MYDGPLALELADLEPVAAAEPASLYGAYCRAVTREGSRELSRKEYERLIREQGDFDLFVDGLAREGCCRTGGHLRKSKLTPKEVGILADYIESERPMRPFGTRTGKNCSSPASACKLFETARSKVDVHLGRYCFRAFRLHKNPTDARLKSFEFTPPRDFAYCLIAPA